MTIVSMDALPRSTLTNRGVAEPRSQMIEVLRVPASPRLGEHLRAPPGSASPRSQLAEHLIAVSHLIHANARAIEQRQVQVRERRAVRVAQVLAALDSAA